MLCDQLEIALPLVDDPAEALEARSRLNAVAAYMASRTKDGKARIAATKLRIEIRVGELLGDPEHGGDRHSDSFKSLATDLNIKKQEAHELRLLAAHKAVAERVIANSDDTHPPSRTKALASIRDVLASERKEKPVKSKPAGRDEYHRGTRHIDPARIIEEAVATLEGLAMALALIEKADYEALDAEKRLEWIQALDQPLSAINRMRKGLRG